MEHNTLELQKYIQTGKRVHLIGIGGVSMRPLGLVLQLMGVQVSGSDMNASVSTDELIAHGICVHIGHRAENVGDAGQAFYMILCLHTILFLIQIDKVVKGFVVGLSLY